MTENKRNKSMFIGIFFLLFGLSIILKAVFHIDIPLFRVFVGILLISVGIRMVFGISLGGRLLHFASANGAAFGHQTFVVQESTDGKNEYNVVFGSGTVDLTKMDAAKSGKVTINVVFGEGVVLYTPKQALQIRSSSVFGSVSTPENQNEAFGESNTSTGTGTPVQVHVNSVFGSVRFQKKSAAE